MGLFWAIFDDLECLLGHPSFLYGLFPLLQAQLRRQLKKNDSEDDIGTALQPLKSHLVVSGGSEEPFNAIDVFKSAD